MVVQIFLNVCSDSVGVFSDMGYAWASLLRDLFSYGLFGGCVRVRASFLLWAACGLSWTCAGLRQCSRCRLALRERCRFDGLL